MVKLGQTVKDTITGFEGVVTARCEYIVGPVRIEVSPVNHATKVPEWFDEARVEIVAEG